MGRKESLVHLRLRGGFPDISFQIAQQHGCRTALPKTLDVVVGMASNKFLGERRLTNLVSSTAG